jgi:hypothetical protein
VVEWREGTGVGGCSGGGIGGGGASLSLMWVVGRRWYGQEVRCVVIDI